MMKYKQNIVQACGPSKHARHATISISLKFRGINLFLALIQNCLNITLFFARIHGSLNQFLVRIPYTLHIFIMYSTLWEESFYRKGWSMNGFKNSKMVARIRSWMPDHGYK
jgi:hypothetical protein